MSWKPSYKENKELLKFDATIRNYGEWAQNIKDHLMRSNRGWGQLLKWAEAHNLELTPEAKFIQAAHPQFTEEQRNIWGFLSGCISGRAEVHFKRAPMLNGLGA